MPKASAITLDDVRKVAKLARLSPSDEQLQRYQGELSAILAYVQRLQELDLSGVEPLANPVEETNRLRADEPHAGLPQSTLVGIAPKATEGLVRVPRILGGDES